MHDALGGMRLIPQWFLWRLVWDSAEQKYQKTPCALNGSVFRIDASLPENWHSYEQVAHAAHMLNSGGTAELRYAMGFWLTKECGYWFFDLDGVAVDGVVNEHAAAMLQAFSGALVEWSSSGRGLHVIGRGAVPAHSTRPPRDLAGLYKYEFYTSGRGIAFGLDGRANGSADTAHDAAVTYLVQHYFPPRAEAEYIARSGPREDWRGPADDDVLIERMLNAKQSAASAFGGKASVGQLWRGEVEKSSEHDMALASHLAFWTGCDEERMVRLMWRSGLVREKWNEHRTYLRELTVRHAIAGCRDVYQEPVRDLRAQQEMYGVGEVRVTHAMPSANTSAISEEQYKRYEELMGLITGAGTLLELHNDVIPAIQASIVPGALQAPLAQALKKQFDFFQSPLSISVIRKLVSPPVVPGTAGSDSPLWVQKHCYVKDGDYFYDMDTGAELTFQGFQAEYARVMPIKPDGRRENPVEWALNRWGMRTVHRVGYRPDQGPYFTFDGFDYANKYTSASVPETATAYTEAGLRGIEAFQTLLWDMCDRRQDVFLNVLWWLAHNVQKPGVKIRWSPVLKGVQGDGKSLITVVLRAAMGYRNVGTTSNATLNNSGGFTDWALGSAVNVIEEIMLTGKERHKLYNAMKEFITNDLVNINAKGDKTYTTFNTTNHFALTNHNDAIPLEKNDRRWMVVFTPWSSLEDMLRYCGLTQAAWDARTAAIDHAWRECQSELRAWLLGVQIGPEFNIRGSAMMTPEKRMMMATSQDDAESAAAQIIEEGALGVTKKLFSSSCLSNMLRFRAAQDNFDIPKTSNLNHMFTRMGFSKFPKPIKWRGATHTIWIKDGFSDNLDEIRLELDASNRHF